MLRRENAFGELLFPPNHTHIVVKSAVIVCRVICVRSAVHLCSYLLPTLNETNSVCAMANKVPPPKIGIGTINILDETVHKRLSFHEEVIIVRSGVASFCRVTILSVTLLSNKNDAQIWFVNSFCSLTIVKIVNTVHCTTLTSTPSLKLMLVSLSCSKLLTKSAARQTFESSSPDVSRL